MPTVHRQLRLGFGAVLAATVITAVVALGALLTTSEQKDEAARNEAEGLRRVADLRLRAEQIVTAGRGYLLTGHTLYQDRFHAANDGFVKTLEEVAPQPGSRREADLVEIRHAWGRYLRAAERAAERRSEEGEDAVVPYFERVMSPARDALEASLDALQRDEREELIQVAERSRVASRRSAFLVGLTSLIAFGVSLWLSSTTRARLGEQFRELEAATDRATKAAASRDELLAVVSHDLRNPVTAILMNSSLALRKLPQTVDSPRAQLERVRSAAERMRHLIEELLETARVDNQGLVLSRAQCDVAPLVCEVVELFEEQAAVKSVRLKSALPVSPAAAWVDKERITRVLANLCGNAVKFTPEGGEVTVKVEPDEGPSWRFSVSDTGPGVPREQLDKLFQKHWQARREGSDGLGLGLYIARNLVEAHGGNIWVTSTPGHGTTFSFRVPAEKKNGP